MYQYKFKIIIICKLYILLLLLSNIIKLYIINYTFEYILNLKNTKIFKYKTYILRQLPKYHLN